MAATEPAAPAFRFDAFISYSRKDADFARRLEQALRGYRPPKDLGVPQRPLRVFRDEADFTGAEYHSALDRNLKDAAKLVVVCSPHAAASAYVADEIRRFSEHRGKDHVVSILLDGIPNNEAKEEEAGRRAFPEELVQLLPIPLAADYRGFDGKRDRIAKGRFAPAWFKTLADVYADYGVDRGKVEQRERRREARRLRNIAAISSAVAVSLVGLTIWALISRHTAGVQRDLSEARRVEVESRLTFDDTGEGLLRAALLAAASLRSTWTIDGQIALTKYLGLLPRPPAWRHAVGDPTGSGIDGGRMVALAFSPDGSRIAITTSGGAVRLFDAATGRQVAAFEGGVQGSDRTVLAFSPDGRSLILGCGPWACVIDPATGREVTRLPQEERGQGGMVWSASFSPDGRVLATAAYGSPQVFLYDASSWQIRWKIEHDPPGVLTVAFSPGGSFMATGDYQSLRLWRTDSYAAPVAQARSKGLPWAIAFGPHGDPLAVANGAIATWDILEDEGAVALQAHAENRIPAHSLLRVPKANDSCFAAASYGATYLLCGPMLEETLRIPVSTSAIAAAPDGRSVGIVDTAGVLASWPLQSGGDVARLALGGSVESLAVAEGKDWIAAGTEGGVVAIVNAETWKQRRRFDLHAAIAAIEPSMDGARLAVSAGAAVHVLDTASWTERYRLSYGSDVAWAGFDAASGALIVVSDNLVVLANPDDGGERVRIAHQGEVEAVRISPDGARLATVSALPRVIGGHGVPPTRTRVLDVQTGKDIGWLDEGQLQDPEPAPGGSPAALHEWGDTALVRASNEWRALPVQEPHEVSSGDGRWTATWSDGSWAVDLKYVPTHRAAATYSHDGEVTAVRFVPATTPRWLVSAGRDGQLRVWPLGGEQLLAETCRRLRGTLSDAALTKRLSELGVADPCPLHPPRR